MMTNGDSEGRFFLSHPYTNNGIFFLHTIIYNIFICKKRLPEVPEYAGMRHINNDVTLMYR